MKKRYSILAGMLALGVATQASAGPIADASFESPALGGGTAYQPGGTSWTFSGYSGISSNGGPFYQGSAPNGTQAAFLQTVGADYYGLGQTYGKIAQNLTGLTVGSFYNLKFDLAARCQGVSCSYGADPLAVSVGGQSLGSFVNTSTTFGTYSASFQATSASMSLAFTANTTYAGTELDTALDNITIAQIGVPAAPEPASWALMILGFGVVGGTLRQKRHAVRGFRAAVVA